MYLYRHSYPPYEHQSYHEAQKSLCIDYEIRYGWEQYYTTHYNEKIQQKLTSLEARSGQNCFIYFMVNIELFLYCQAIIFVVVFNYQLRFYYFYPSCNHLSLIHFYYISLFFSIVELFLCTITFCV